MLDRQIYKKNIQGPMLRLTLSQFHVARAPRDLLDQQVLQHWMLIQLLPMCRQELTQTKSRAGCGALRSEMKYVSYGSYNQQRNDKCMIRGCNLRGRGVASLTIDGITVGSDIAPDSFSSSPENCTCGFR